MYFWQSLFEVIWSFPIARSRWISHDISPPFFFRFASHSRTRQLRRQIYGFSWQWRKRRVAGGSWRICQAAADTRVRRFSGNSRISPSGDARYTHGRIFLTMHRGASFPARGRWEISKPNSNPVVASSSGGGKDSNLFAAARIVAAHGKKLAETWNAHPVKYDGINISREEGDGLAVYDYQELPGAAMTLRR